MHAPPRRFHGLVLQSAALVAHRECLENHGSLLLFDIELTLHAAGNSSGVRLRTSALGAALSTEIVKHRAYVTLYSRQRNLQTRRDLSCSCGRAPISRNIAEVRD